MRLKTILNSTLLSILTLTLSAQVKFRKIILSTEYHSEGASIADINTDGHPDVITGPLWWEGPDFKASHSYAPVKVFPIKGPGLSGYSNNFFTFPSLITADKWPDILKVGIPNKASYLAINPGKKVLPATNLEHSCKHCLAQQNVCNESPQFLNILPGKQKHLLAYSNNHITIAEPAGDATKPWKVFNISAKNKRFKTYTHGLGAADINGDKLTDILEKSGWWAQPANWDKKTPWVFHPFAFAPKKGGAQMYGYDIDGDNDTDVVTALDAHGYGLAWYEQTKSTKGKIIFKQHLIMPEVTSNDPQVLSFSQPHAMACTDIDGDGIKDIITGKCFFAHGGKDPGAKDPAVLYWFRTTRTEKGTSFTPHLIDENSGVGRQISTGDLNGDGKPDIAISNKKGTYIFIQVTP